MYLGESPAAWGEPKAWDPGMASQKDRVWGDKPRILGVTCVYGVGRGVGAQQEVEKEELEWGRDPGKVTRRGQGGGSLQIGPRPRRQQLRSDAAQGGQSCKCRFLPGCTNICLSPNAFFERKIKGCHERFQNCA